MSSIVPASETELSIIVQVHRLADPTEKDSCKEMEIRCWDSAPYTLTPLGCPSARRSLDPPHTNSWFIIRNTATEPKIFEIFRDLPQDQLIHSRQQTNCAIVGSHLFDIGGCGSSPATRYHLSNKIRRLDTLNPDDGWKTETLPFYCAEATSAVSGNFIYLFPHDPYFIGDEWAYIYDTDKQQAYPIQFPSNCESSSPCICFPLDHSLKGPGVLVPLSDKKGRTSIYLHKTCEDSWEPLDSSLCDWREHTQPYAISNGVLYLCEMYKYSSLMLCIHDITRSSAPLICQFRLPKFDNLDIDACSSMFMVVVAESKLCFMWHNEGYNETSPQSPLYYAKVSVSLEPCGATLLQQAALDINAIGILNCLPFSMPQGYLQESNEQDSGHKSKKPEKLEVDWKRRCKSLERRLKDMKRHVNNSRVDWKRCCKSLERRLKDMKRRSKNQKGVIQRLQKVAQG